jgi:hypothetical protein
MLLPEYWLYGMHPVVCYLRKVIIWDSRTRDSQKENIDTTVSEDDPGKGSKLAAMPPKNEQKQMLHSSVYFVPF